MKQKNSKKKTPQGPRKHGTLSLTYAGRESQKGDQFVLEVKKEEKKTTLFCRALMHAFDFYWDKAIESVGMCLIQV
jgi:hypothetical protein